MSDFIKQQQELARRQLLCMWPSGEDLTKETLNTMDMFITQIIHNTGEELMRLASEDKLEAELHYDMRGMENTRWFTIGIDTIKQHITSVTGVE